MAQVNFTWKSHNKPMSHEEILANLKAGKSFSGRNGAFNGIMTFVGEDENGNPKVRCQKDGYSHIEVWDDDILYTLYAFDNGDYYFLDI